MRSVLLEKLFLDHQLKMENCDGGAQEDCYWCIYENEEGDVNVVVEYYFDKHVEYEATVLLYDNDEIKKSFKEGEEMELIKFITTDKMKLAQNREFERINKDFK